MKMPIGLLSMLLALAVVSLQARAQDSDSSQPPAPTRPYIGALPAEFSLVEKYTYLAPETKLTAQQSAAEAFMNPASSKIKELDATAKSGVRKDTTHFVDGNSQDVWRIRTCRLTVNSAHPESIMSSIVASGPFNPNAPNQYRDASDFAELAWVEQASFTGVQMQLGKKCYTFKSGEQTAWIDTATHLPVYFASKDITVAYVFSESPDEPLKVPPAIADRFEKLNRVMHGQL